MSIIDKYKSLKMGETRQIITISPEVSSELFKEELLNKNINPIGIFKTHDINTDYIMMNKDEYIEYFSCLYSIGFDPQNIYNSIVNEDENYKYIMPNRCLIDIKLSGIKAKYYMLDSRLGINKTDDTEVFTSKILYLNISKFSEFLMTLDTDELTVDNVKSLIYHLIETSRIPFESVNEFLDLQLQDMLGEIILIKIID